MCAICDRIDVIRRRYREGIPAANLEETAWRAGRERGWNPEDSERFTGSLAEFYRMGAHEKYREGK